MVRYLAAGAMVVIACVAMSFSGDLAASSRAAPSAPFEQAVFNPVADAVISSQFPTQNFGNIGDLAVAVRSTDAIDVYTFDRSLLAFDLATLPEGAEIDTATLELYQKGSTGAVPVTIRAFPVTAAWTESEVTWDNQPTFDTSRSTSATLDATDGYKSWDVTELAREWLAGNGYGVILHGPELPPVMLRVFHSVDLNEFIPRLTVTYHVPPPVGDLVVQTLQSDPNPAFPGETIKLTAEVHNAGTTPYTNVPVHFYADDGELAVTTLATLEAGATVAVSMTTDFELTAVYRLAVHVNPAATLEETTPDNNYAELFQLVVIEKSPVWSRPDMVLRGIAFDPARPDAGQNVTVTTQVYNTGRADLTSVLVALFVDGAVVDESIITDLLAGTAQELTLHINAAAAGRHMVALIADPEQTMDERSTEDSEVREWLRVAGEPGARPDIEVTAIRLRETAQTAALSMRELPIEIELHNAGYAGVSNLPVEVLVDGQQAGILVVPSLGPDEISSLPLPLPYPGRGHHVITARLDPDNSLDLDLIQREWAEGFLFSTPNFQPQLYTLGTAAELAGRWEFVGPRPMQSDSNGNVYIQNGRVDGVSVSQDAKTLVVGSVGGGIWRSVDYGATWKPITDPLNQPEFTRVALDPKDPNIIYGLSGASYSIYKSLDGGASWSLFANRLVNQASTSFTKIIVRYESANTVTLYIADSNGLWVWQGDPIATSATTWHRVWQQTRNAHPNATSEVTDFYITPESTPQVYLGAFRDAVYRLKLADLLSAVSQNLTPTWTALETGMTLGRDAVRFFLAGSPANAGRVFTLISRGTECAKDSGTSLDLYRLDGSATQWTHVSTPTNVNQKPNICGIRYAAFLAVNPANANVLYIGGVPGYRSTDGGVTFPHRIPYVHDDYKAVAFNPSDASEVFFTSDGGIYRCTNSGATCDSLNHDLETGMFFDIAVAGAQTPLIIGGTQDNGTQRYDGDLTWKYIRGGDGKFCAIDPTNNDIMYTQHQYADDTFRSSVGGNQWTAADTGLPTYKEFTGWPYLVMHPNTPATLLIAAGTANGQGQVYRTVNSGGQWNPIGPAPALTRGQIGPIVIDGPNNRYYAGSSGEIWATTGSNAGQNGWTRIYEDTAQGGAHEMILDPDDPDTLYAVFNSSGARRVIQLHRTGGTWPGTAANWEVTHIGGGLPDKVVGGPNGAVRGLALEPNPGSATVLYVGTDRGLYQGRREAGSTTWSWTLDSCGLPRTYVSDIAVHSSDSWLAAATYGRGVYTRNTGNTIRNADSYEQPVRNDTFATAAQLPPMVVPNSPMLSPSLVVNGLTLDRGDDVDYFTAQLPPFNANDCLPANDPQLADPDVYQCMLSISIQAPDTPDPFELALYRSDGSVVLTPTTSSGLSIAIERPYDDFADGELTLRVRDLTGCRSQYNLQFWYSPWVTIIDVPPLLYDPPLFKRIVPDLGDFPWVFPGDPELIDLGFLEPLDELPEQRVTFYWSTLNDFAATMTVAGGRTLEMTLYDAQNQPIANGAQRVTTANDDVKEIQVEALPVGWYALGFHGGAFPTFFSVDVEGVQETLRLPMVKR